MRWSIETFGWGLVVAGTLMANPYVVGFGAVLIAISYLWDLVDMIFGPNAYEKLAKELGYEYD